MEIKVSILTDEGGTTKEFTDARDAKTWLEDRLYVAHPLFLQRRGGAHTSGEGQGVIPTRKPNWFQRLFGKHI